jgi:hypothetical protein
MQKLNVKQKNWLLSAHIGFAGIWFGTALCMVVIGLANQHNPSGDGLFAVNTILKTLDDFVIIPTAILSLLTGCLLCWLTNWGFFKHYWVIVKLIATVLLIVIGTIWLGPWVNELTSISEVGRINALQNAVYQFDWNGAVIGGILQTTAVFIIIAISTLKPWGRRKTQTVDNAN